MNHTSIERSIWIAASCERVWHAITDPAQVEQWFSPGTRWQLSALQVGGRLFVLNTETGAEMYIQVIEMIEPPQRLILYSAGQPPTEPENRTTYTLLEEHGGTRLTLVYIVYAEALNDTLDQYIALAGQGFTGVLENIKAHSEGSSLPFPQGF